MIRAFLFSDLRRVSRQVLREAGEGPVLVIDSAMPARDRVGAGGRFFDSHGLTRAVCDPLTEALPDFSGFATVFMSGGNPFRLLLAARACGLREALLRRAEERPLTVLGGSAGAMVLGTDIRHAAVLAPDLGVKDASGFGWVDGRVMPHIDKGGDASARLRAAVDAAPRENWVLLREKDFLAIVVEPEPGWGPAV